MRYSLIYIVGILTGSITGDLSLTDSRFWIVSIISAAIAGLVQVIGKKEAK